MKHLVVEVRAGEALAAQLAQDLPALVGRPVNPLDVEKLLVQGSVFWNKARWRDPGPPARPMTLEIFWPDLPVEEFTLDPRCVVWQDEHLLVVDKPAGVNSAPSPFSDRDCLTWGVEKYLGRGFPIHAVHRLDRDTRGLIFFAKHKEAEQALHAMFRLRQVRKVYRALTPPQPGLPPGTVFRWKDTLDWRGHVQGAATTALLAGPDPAGRLIWTVLPHTGRPHQIRRHFARYLVPLWGDRVYAPGTYGPDDTLGLACVAYRCRHPVTREPLRLNLPLDEGPEIGP